MTPIEHKDRLKCWITTRLKPSKRINKYYSTYSLRHLFQYSPGGCYVDDRTFNEVMAECGYDATGEDINLPRCFNVRQSSINRIFDWINGIRD